MSLVPRHSIFDLDSFFDNTWIPFRAHSAEHGVFSPRVDIKDTGDSYEISAELPGIKKEDVHVSLQDGVLSIEAETRSENKEEKDGQIIRQERRYGKFFRSFDLGPQVHEGDITASFDDGVLKLSAPKTEPKEQAVKRIEIK
ncbi:Hsp20/alpha crystallin family protein [Teredinibacter sp. KSP-S5-2]|uniref:Hsp20/alpha crystallin family protein n=1 Tax=Teredinibacter sp. KSP-S5-2 TaxID=3034506 RepID=UPI0029350253|nr:Hsp20/alpha crystallin family protein [Teredinibacter sp. KSP-S5-2]WNO08608.1 Hsp20/alpha crystallin family protein [Teredinibacter sp. KSP-S5-2]